MNSTACRSQLQSPAATTNMQSYVQEAQHAIGQPHYNKAMHHLMQSGAMSISTLEHWEAAATTKLFYVCQACCWHLPQLFATPGLCGRWHQTAKFSCKFQLAAIAVTVQDGMQYPESQQQLQCKESSISSTTEAYSKPFVTLLSQQASKRSDICCRSNDT